jgi:hypothetical protein
VGYEILLINGLLGLSPLRAEPSQPIRLQMSPNLFRICSSEKYAYNPFVSRTSKIQDLNSFRIRTYEKMGEGASNRAV